MPNRYELSRRRFLQAAASVAVMGVAVPFVPLEWLERESFSSLDSFLQEPQNPESQYGEDTRFLLSYLDLQTPAQLRWVHRADNRRNLLSAMDNDRIHAAEIDLRCDKNGNAYVAHGLHDTSDLTLNEAFEIIGNSGKKKLVKWDCKDTEVVFTAVPRIAKFHEEQRTPSILNQSGMNLSQADFVGVAAQVPHALMSMGISPHNDRDAQTMIDRALLLADSYHRDFTLPVKVTDFIEYNDIISHFLNSPSRTLTLYSSQPHTTRDVLQELPKIIDRSKTFFDVDMIA